MSKKNDLKKILSALVSFVLITATALSSTGCQEKKDKQVSNDTGSSVTAEQTEQIEQQQMSFKFNVVDADGKETSFDISTDEKTVGAALLKEGLIAGDESEYGLYVKTVNGITADFDSTGTYWAFYIGDTYASTGVDSTDIKEGETYSFKIEKG